MLEKLQEIVRKCTGNTNLSITADMLISTDLGVNSLEMVQIICEIEDLCGIEIPDREIVSFKTVQNVLDYLSANGQCFSK